jgi:hypothetical protein
MQQDVRSRSERLISHMPDEDSQLAEAIMVVEHAIQRAKRGGRQGGPGRRPSMVYSAERARNPRKCLDRAYKDLGFSSLTRAKLWFEEQPFERSKKLQLHTVPQPKNIEQLEFEISHATVRVDYPSRIQTYLKHLDKPNLGDVRPLIVGVRDAKGKTSRINLKIMSDPFPENRDSVYLDGKLLMQKGRTIDCLDGETHAIFPGHMARLHIDESRSIQHLEFLDLINEDYTN